MEEMLVFSQPARWWVCSLVFWTYSVFKYPYDTSDIHAISIVGLSIGSLLDFVPEAPRHLFSVGYFVVTCVQMMVRRDMIKVVHHIISIIAGMLGLIELDGFFLEYKLSSKILLIEFSTPLLHWYKRSNSKKVGAAFAVSFISLRTFWLGYVVYELFKDARLAGTITTKLLAAQWLLNQYWTLEILNKFLGKSKKNGELKGKNA